MFFVLVELIIFRNFNFSSCFIGDIRKRCKEELKGDVEYTSMTICHDDCELSDDTPIQLVLADEKILKCIISGWAKPSAAQIYAKRTRSNYIFFKKIA